MAMARVVVAVMLLAGNLVLLTTATNSTTTASSNTTTTASSNATTTSAPSNATTTAPSNATTTSAPSNATTSAPSNATTSAPNVTNGTSNATNATSNATNATNATNDTNGTNSTNGTNGTNDTNGTNGTTTSPTTTTTTPGNGWFPTGCYRNACGCPDSTTTTSGTTTTAASNGTTTTAAPNGTTTTSASDSCEGTGALVQDDKCQQNEGVCLAPGQGCDGAWCASTVTTTCPPDLTEGCYKTTCGCGSSDSSCLVADDKCQKNKGICEAPGQNCGGMWCTPSECSTTGTTTGNTTTAIFTTLATTTIITTPTTPTTTTTTTTNADCTANIIFWALIMTAVDSSNAQFDSIVTEAIASALQTALDCVTAEATTDTRRLLSARRLVTGTKGSAGVNKDMTEDEINEALKNPSLTTDICSQLSTGTECRVEGTGGFTTTTEMPWGMPWWAWFLICLGSCCLLAFCCLPLLAAPAMGGKKKSKATPSTEVVYEVVDVPDDNVPLTTAY